MNLENILLQNLSNDNKARAEAEHLLNEYPKQFGKDKFILDLIEFISSNCKFQKDEKISIARFACIIIDNNMKANSKTQQEISDKTKFILMKSLLEIVCNTDNEMLAHTISDTISRLANRKSNMVTDAKNTEKSKETQQSLGRNGEFKQSELNIASHWEDLWSTIFKMSASESKIHRSCVYRILNELAEYSVESIRVRLNHILKILVDGLRNSDQKIRLDALQATISLQLSINDNEAQHFKEIIPIMFDLLCSAKDTEIVKGFCQRLIKLVEVRGHFFEDYFQQICVCMKTIVEAGQADMETRQLALEILVAFGQNSPLLVQKYKDYASITFNIALLFLRDFDISMNQTEDYFEDQELFASGISAIEKLGSILDDQVAIQLIFPIVNNLLNSGNSAWDKDRIVSCVSAIVVVSRICQGPIQWNLLPQILDFFRPYMEMNLQKIPNAISQALSHCFNELSQNYEDEFQCKYHKSIVPYLIGVIACEGLPSKNYKEAVCALSCVFAEDSTAVFVGEYLDQLMNVLSARIKSALVSGDEQVQQESFETLSVVVSCSGNQFVKYYNEQFLSGIFEFINNSKSSDIRASALQFIGVIVEAVGKEKIQGNVKQIMDCLMHYESNSDVTDEERMSIYESYTRIAKTTGDQINPYLDHIIPKLLDSCRLDSGSLEDEEGEEPNKLSTNAEGDSIYTVHFHGVGTKKLTLNTAILQEKAVACHLIYEFCLNCSQEVYYKYANDTLILMCSLIRFAFSEHVRRAALVTIPLLIKIFSSAQKSGKVEVDLNKIFGFVFEKLNMALGFNFGVDSLANILTSINESIQYYEQPLSDEIQVALLKNLRDKLIDSRQRCNEYRENRSGKLTCDRIREEIDLENSFFGNIVECISNMVKSTKALFITNFHNILYPEIVKLLDSNDISERTNAMYIFIDLVEFGEEPSRIAYSDTLYNYGSKYSFDKDVDLRQSSYYGLGLLAQVSFGKVSLGDKNQAILQIMLAVINESGSRNPENAAATDNAISTIAKLVRYQNLDSRILFEWIKWLPINDDIAEAQVVNENLCLFFNNDQTRLNMLGKQNQNLGQLISIFGWILETNQVNQQTTDSIHQIWRNIRSSFTKDNLEVFLSNLEPVQIQKLNKIAS